MVNAAICSVALIYADIQEEWFPKKKLYLPSWAEQWRWELTVAVEMIFIAPEELQMPSEIINDLTKMNCKFTQKSTLLDNLDDIDVLYMTRIQKERFPDPKEYLKVKGQYTLKKSNIEGTDIILMHPLPRVDEIDFDVDSLDNAMYFKQAFYGVPVRMAILDSVIKK